MQCVFCKGFCIKKGIKNKVQTYYCKSCKKYQRHTTKSSVMKQHLEREIIRFNNEGLGIRSIARLTHSNVSYIVRSLLGIAKKIVPPIVSEYGASYEIDEIQTYIGKNIQSNYTWITYAINQRTKAVITFIVGRRTKENLKAVTNKVLALKPKSIYTDGLIIYRSLIDKAIHKVQRFKINHIERKNLTLRTHLKRLNRRTICYSRSLAMLHACLTIYFYA
jgi:insertion element IS1 protein InsB